MSVNKYGNSILSFKCINPKSPNHTATMTRHRMDLTEEGNNSFQQTRRLMSRQFVRDIALWNTYSASEMSQKYVVEEVCGTIDKSKL